MKLGIEFDLDEELRRGSKMKENITRYSWRRPDVFMMKNEPTFGCWICV